MCGSVISAEQIVMDKPLREGSIVLLHPLDDIPEHRFRVWETYEDCFTGYSLDGPLEGVYGEPGYELLKSVIQY